MPTSRPASPLSFAIASVAVTLGCTDAHVQPPDAGVDARYARDARLVEDAHFPPVVEWHGNYSFGNGGFVSDIVGTDEGELCIAGFIGPRWFEHENEAFVRCYDTFSITRSRHWACAHDSWGATRLATGANGDLFVLLDGDCGGVERSQRIERLDRALATRATTTVSSAGFGPDLAELAADDRFLVVGGSLRGPGIVGDVEVEGPIVIVYSAEDLTPIHVVGRAPAGDSREGSSVAFVAIRDDVALLFGRDVIDGAFAPSGGTFVRTMRLPDGTLEPAGPAGDWHHQYDALWHPEGHPMVLGTRGGQTLQVGIGDAVTPLETGYAGAPHAVVLGDELLIARPFFDRIQAADRTFTSDELGGGFLLAVDVTTLEPVWARELPAGYRDYRIDVSRDGTIGVLGRDPVDPTEPTISLTLWSRSP